MTSRPLQIIALSILFAVGLISPARALTITEVMYNPEGRDQDREWVEVYNDESWTVDPAALRFFDGRRHRVSGETLPPGEYAVLVPKPEQFRVDYPELSVRLWDTVMSIRNQGEVIRILTTGGQELASSFASPLSGGDGNGYSIELRDGRWQESETLGGAPGGLSRAMEPGSVTLHEVIASPAEGEEESIEVESSANEFTLVDGSGEMKRLNTRGRQRLGKKDHGQTLNNKAEMIRAVDRRGRELAATPIFISRRKGERLRFDGGRFTIVPP